MGVRFDLYTTSNSSPADDAGVKCRGSIYEPKRPTACCAGVPLALVPVTHTRCLTDAWKLHLLSSVAYFLAGCLQNEGARGNHNHTCTPRPRYIQKTYMRIRTTAAPWPQTAVRLLHPKSRWARSILRRRSFLRPPRSRQMRVLLVWRGVEVGGGFPVRRHSFVSGARIELWRASDWLTKRQKTVGSQTE